MQKISYFCPSVCSFVVVLLLHFPLSADLPILPLFILVSFLNLLTLSSYFLEYISLVHPSLFSLPTLLISQHLLSRPSSSSFSLSLFFYFRFPDSVITNFFREVWRKQRMTMTLSKCVALSPSLLSIHPS